MRSRGFAIPTSLYFLEAYYCTLLLCPDLQKATGTALVVYLGQSEVGFSCKKLICS